MNYRNLATMALSSALILEACAQNQQHTPSRSSHQQTQPGYRKADVEAVHQDPALAPAEEAIKEIQKSIEGSQSALRKTQLEINQRLVQEGIKQSEELEKTRKQRPDHINFCSKENDNCLEQIEAIRSSLLQYVSANDCEFQMRQGELMTKKRLQDCEIGTLIKKGKGAEVNAYQKQKNKCESAVMDCYYRRPEFGR